ncbi:MAG: tRNA pseudouridine(13) synthase TruD [Candidatus Nezhaarchaeota archaeon]|nr:tRNA pseudouridine(13) synthase TruD [Candidatus Nezhaarchaeota archaeon]
MPRPTASPLDLQLGMEMYATDTDGVGGILRSKVDDFVVKEILEVERLEGRYVLALIEKRGVDTLAAARLIAKRLKIPASKVSFAGLKDSSALAFQFFSIGGVEVNEVKGLDAGRVRVVSAEPFNRELRASMVKVNSFGITLRRIPLQLAEALSVARLTIAQLLAYGGPPNYYGYQRFGSKRPNTHIVGKLLLESRFKDAFEEFVFHPYPWESEAARRAREAGDAKKALRLMPKYLTYERSLLRYLERHPGCYEEAFKRMPLKLLRLMVEAYQAYLFNRALSERMRSLPSFSEPVEGDYVVLRNVSWRLEKPSDLERAKDLIKSRHAYVAMPLPSPEIAHRGPAPFLENALRREGLELSNMPKPPIPGLRLRASLRTVVAPLLAVAIMGIERGEDGASMSFRFQLPRGCYATSLLREVVKPNDPAAAGF